MPCCSRSIPCLGAGGFAGAGRREVSVQFNCLPHPQDFLPFGDCFRCPSSDHILRRGGGPQHHVFAVRGQSCERDGRDGSSDGIWIDGL